MNQPATLLPPDARARFKTQAESICRVYRQPVLRAEAIQHLIDKLHEDFPFAFKTENHGLS